MTPEQLFELLDAWTNKGWMRSLDRAFVRFLNREAPQESGEVLLAAALVSHQLGRGHVCLDLAIALADPDATLSLPPEGETGEDLPDKPSQVLQGLTLKTWEAFLMDSVLVSRDTQQRPGPGRRCRFFPQIDGSFAAPQCAPAWGRAFPGIF